MNETTRFRIERAWDVAFKPIMFALLLVNAAVVFFVARLVLSETYAEAYWPLQMSIAVVMVGAEFFLLDMWIRPDFRSSPTLKGIVTVGAVAVLAMGWWVSSERVPSEPDREMDNYRQQLRGLPGADAVRQTEGRRAAGGPGSDGAK